MSLQRLNNFHEWLRVKFRINYLLVSFVQYCKLPYWLILHWKYISCRVQQLDHCADHFKNKSLLASRFFLKFFFQFRQSGSLFLPINIQTSKYWRLVVRKHINTHRSVLYLHCFFKLALRTKGGYRVADESWGVWAGHFVHWVICSNRAVILTEWTIKQPLTHLFNRNVKFGNRFLYFFITWCSPLLFSLKKLTL